ncbi:hypothetical protein BGW36DRAFT_369065 [Talaromyces proteolyticus]|uniref:BZIP domain-containing protein n=1 Tax=Talaromyces proteolyticus TaxID=1131652 RepID=A0AAD4Q4Q9_9EURO|nr:uncharacterized protein BGW36DRAFT_369065 [Talaromyces proteolyticus]KAH8703265.1 hypothetical protein BGW36DRAFT_369065 [Talaromyces proteolyticus]
MSNPEQGRTTAPGQETLWKHARRTLGDKYFSFLKTITDPPQPTETSAGQVQNDPMVDPQTKAYVRRRDQIRRSQRTHRARTEQYVLGLESEVGRLRLAHADCVALVKSIHQKLGQFMPEYAYERTAAAQSQAATQIPSQPKISEPGVASNGWNSESTSCLHEKGQFPNTQQVRRITDALLSSEVGLEFVMRLETPCLQYVREDLASQDLSASPDTCQPSSDAGCAMRRKLAREANPLAATPVGASAERLLALSSRLDLGEGLITPIQAWDKMKAHPLAHLLSSDKIYNIIAKSQSITSCHRHGAALDSQKFEELLNHILR